MDKKPGDHEIPANQRRYRVGGLMRCCEQTLADVSILTKVGDELACFSCLNSMVVASDGIWQAIPRDDRLPAGQSS